MIGLFCRAFAQVSLISLNVAYLAQQRPVEVFVTSFLVSTAWWWNTKSAAHSGSRLEMLVYCTGAACGGVSGMWWGYFF